MSRAYIADENNVACLLEAFYYDDHFSYNYRFMYQQYVVGLDDDETYSTAKYVYYLNTVVRVGQIIAGIY
jgi:hypothetical protein